jgi:ubiquinone/menaquinone biosynthesis C-methylase UbiE
MSVSDGYDAWAASYDSDRNLTRDLDEEATRTTLADLRPRSVLELGCGTGKNTLFLARIGGQVRALDFSAGMLAQARAKQPGTNVSFSLADLTRTWPCDDASADLIVANLVLEHIADLGFIFAEAARCLEPGGRMFLSELHPFKQYLGSQARFERDQASVPIPAFTHHISEFLAAAGQAGLSLLSLQEWWHAEDPPALPRLVSFLFERRD